MTFLELINRVLIAVGQGDDLVSGATTDTYHLKVAQFVNDFLEEVEGAAPWRVLRTTVSATVAANGNSIALSGVNERTRLWREVDPFTKRDEPLCFDVTDTSAQYQLSELDLATLLRRDQEESNVVSGSRPSHFAIERTASGITLYVYPRSSTGRDIEIDLLVPQARLSAGDDTDLATSIKVPGLPVQYGASWWAMEDRGEELGPRGDKAERRYRDLLADAVASEIAEQGADELVPQ